MSTAGSPDPEYGTKPPLALIAGPTASGKSDLAVDLALALQAQGRDAAIINCDSAQVYRDLHALSARPTEEEMRGVTHHLFGTWDGAIACSTTDWARRAKTIVAQCHAGRIVPILVGGTGLYIRTLLDGISPIPPIDPGVRAHVRGMSREDARAALNGEDPEAAARLAPADTTRTMRALEVVRSTGRPIAHYHGKQEGGIGASIDLHPLILSPDRATLYERCDMRFVRMLDGGAIEEVERLSARHLDPQLPVMRAIGVREIMAFLRGDIDRTTLIGRGMLATRQYAKRQFTWFRNQPPSDWPRTEANAKRDLAPFERLFHK
ncbi:MAG: tRNA (adenosine(37)-N6)-dimethylallyltransferase MiaA [Pontixanthobacter sp.]